MNERYIKLTGANVDYLYDNGYMNKGRLVKYRYLDSLLIAYELDETDNGWNIGIISQVHVMTYTKGGGLWQMTVSENGIEEQLEYVYDLIVHTSEPDMPSERVSTDSHEIYLAKV
tara:strand:- start:280 stop:624 length:345 start_codon:yes stop_codon:yes gene_type:complete